MVQQRREKRRYGCEKDRPYSPNRFQHVVEIAGVRDERKRISTHVLERLHAQIGVDVEKRERQQDRVFPLSAQCARPRPKLQP